MKSYDVFGIGNALVDILVLLDDHFLTSNKIHKGVMTLVDEEAQGELLLKLAEYKKELRSGGSAANTMIALSNIGGTGCYTGKVSHDTYGEFYKKDMEFSGIHFETKPESISHTGTCLILTTPDAERTMLTSLGISSTITKADIDEDRLKNSKFIYVEGYLWDKPDTKQACIHAMELAKKHKVKISFTYSDPFCVERSKEEFIKLTKEYCDLVFCNLAEGETISGEKDPEAILKKIGSWVDICCMTSGKEGARVMDKNTNRLIPGFPVKPLDTTGAGDVFAAGVLYGLTHDLTLPKSVRLGNYMASRIVQEIGPRLSVKLMGREEEILGDFV